MASTRQAHWFSSGIYGRALSGGGGALLLATHSLDIVEHYADRAGSLDRRQAQACMVEGRVAAIAGSPRRFRSRHWREAIGDPELSAILSCEALSFKRVQASNAAFF